MHVVDARYRVEEAFPPVAGSRTENTIKIDCLAKKFLSDPTTFFMLPPATPLVGPADPVEDSFAPMDQEEAEKLLLDSMTKGLCTLQAVRAFTESENPDDQECGIELLNNAIETLKTLNSLSDYVFLASYLLEKVSLNLDEPLENVEQALDQATEELDNLPPDYPLEFKEVLILRLLSIYYLLLDYLEIRKNPTEKVEAKIEQYKGNYVLNNPDLSLFNEDILPRVRQLQKAQMLAQQGQSDNARELYKGILAELKDSQDRYMLLDHATCFIGIARLISAEKRAPLLEQAWEDLDLAKDLFDETFSSDSAYEKCSFYQALISSYFRIKMWMPPKSDLSEIDARISECRLQLNNRLTEPHIPQSPKRKKEFSCSFSNTLTTRIFALFGLAVLGFSLFIRYKLIRRTYTY